MPIHFAWKIDKCEFALARKNSHKFAQIDSVESEQMANSAGERMFNPVRVVHTWNRNRMWKSWLADILYIYINYRSLKKLGVLQAVRNNV